MNSLENDSTQQPHNSIDVTRFPTSAGPRGTRLMVSNRGGVSSTMRGPRIILFSSTRMSSFSIEPSAGLPPPHWRTGKVSFSSPPQLTGKLSVLVLKPKAWISGQHRRKVN